MRIVIDARTLGWTGIGRYVHHLLLELEKLDEVTEYIILLRDADRGRWQPTSANFTVVTANMEPYSLAEQTQLPGLLRSLKPDLVHFAQFSAPLLYRGPSVVTIHDLTLVNFRNVRGSGWRKVVYEVKYWAGRLVLWNITHTAKQIITDARFVRSELLTHRGSGLLAVKPDKVTAIHLATDFTQIMAKKPDWIDAKVPFALYVGNYYPNKNIGRLLEAFRLVAGKDQQTKLVLVGKSDYFQKQLQQKAADLGLVDRVVFPGFVPDEELGWLYEHARLYAYVSLSEGFGIPGLEAMAASVPVLSSNASCLPEVYGEAALYCDPMDTGDMAEKMIRLLSDEPLRRQLVTAGKKQVASYSWQRMAGETLVVYRRALG
jgi:glycosyltransferase involved in cell wall biosynthesis